MLFWYIGMNLILSIAVFFIYRNAFENTGKTFISRPVAISIMLVVLFILPYVAAKLVTLYLFYRMLVRNNCLKSLFRF